MGEKYYIFVGHAEGQFEVMDGPNKGKKQAYCHMFAITPVSDFESADYHASGEAEMRLPLRLERSYARRAVQSLFR